MIGMQIATNWPCFIRVLFGVCALALVSACALPSKHPSVRPDASALPTAFTDPEELGWSTEGLYAIRELTENLGSAAVLIVTDGKVVFSYGDVAANFRAHSIRKSFLSALYGIAVTEGRIDSTKTLLELGIDDKTALTESEAQATIADLLKCRSGVYLAAASEAPSQRESRPKRHEYAPGTHWYYNNWDHNVLGSIYRQETGTDIFEAFQRQIAIPIGMRDFDLNKMRYQYEEMSVHPSYKFRLSARDLARFGLLYLNKGLWRGRQVIPADWVETSTRAYSVTGRKGTKGGYGMMWWVVMGSENRRESFLESGAYTASGLGGHRLTILPKINTVVVHRTDTDDPNAPRIGSSTYDRFLRRVLQARTPGDGA